MQRGPVPADLGGLFQAHDDGRRNGVAGPPHVTAGHPTGFLLSGERNDAILDQNAAPIRQASVNTGPPPPPPPPPINLGFYGYAAEKTGQKQVFLLHGDDIFIASEGDVVDRRYRVVKIGAASVQVEDIPYHNTQTLPLRQ